MGQQRYSCLECGKEHQAEIWYTREVAGTPQYVCSPKLHRSELENGWEQLPIPENR